MGGIWSRGSGVVAFEAGRGGSDVWSYGDTAEDVATADFVRARNANGADNPPRFVSFPLASIHVPVSPVPIHVPRGNQSLSLFLCHFHLIP